MKKSLIVEDVRLERVRVAFPTGLTVPEALEAGILIGGAEFVTPELRAVAEDRLEERGVAWMFASPHRRELRGGLRTAAPGR